MLTDENSSTAPPRPRRPPRVGGQHFVSTEAVIAVTQQRNPVSLTRIVTLLIVLGGLGVGGYFGYGFVREELDEREARELAHKLPWDGDSVIGEKFTAADGGFRIAFPSAPERGEESFAGMPVTYYLSEAKSVVFGTIFASVPGRIPDEGLREILADAAADDGGRLVSSKPREIAGVTGLEGVAEGGEFDFGRMVVFQARGRLYLLLVGADSDPPQGYEAFFKSFALT